MTSEVDRQIERSDALLERTRSRYRDAGAPPRLLREATIARRLGRIAIADIAILVAALVIGWIVPLGIGGAMLVMAALIAATVLLAVFPVVKPPSPAQFRQTPVRILPMKTTQWLAMQRAKMPPAVARALDAVQARLDALAPQLAKLDDDGADAAAVRKLVGEDLPGLVEGYERVPPSLRGTVRGGATPDTQLADGLKVIEREIAAMTARLAEGDIDDLATRGRYLETKYRDDTLGGS